MTGRTTNTGEAPGADEASGAGKTTGADKIHKDAQGQFAISKKGATNNGVSSAKPRTITGSDDATVHRNPPGTKKSGKDWSPNFDPAERHRRR